MTPPPVRVTASAIAHHTAWARFVCYPSLLSHFLGGRLATRPMLRVLVELPRASASTIRCAILAPPGPRNLPISATHAADAVSGSATEVRAVAEVCRNASGDSSPLVAFQSGGPRFESRTAHQQLSA